MTTTPEQIEAVARAMCEAMGMDPNEVQTSGETEWPLWVEFQKVAIAAVNAMRPFIRAEVLEEAAKRVAELPMIVGIPGLPYERHRNSFEYAAAIRALKEKP